MEIPALTTDFSLISRGLKTTNPEFNEEEQKRLEEYKDNLKLLLGLERVVYAKGRSFGIYEPELNRIRVERLEGKWIFGFVEEKQQYLHPHEALYLIEMVRISNK